MELVDTERTYVKVSQAKHFQMDTITLSVLTALEQLIGKLSRTAQEGNVLIER